VPTVPKSYLASFPTGLQVSVLIAGLAKVLSHPETHVELRLGRFTPRSQCQGGDNRAAEKGKKQKQKQLQRQGSDPGLTYIYTDKGPTRQWLYQMGRYLTPSVVAEQYRTSLISWSARE